jgi:hypothetical protein
LLVYLISLKKEKINSWYNSHIFLFLEIVYLKWCVIEKIVREQDMFPFGIEIVYEGVEICFSYAFYSKFELEVDQWITSLSQYTEYFLFLSFSFIFPALETLKSFMN